METNQTPEPQSFFQKYKKYVMPGMALGAALVIILTVVVINDVGQLSGVQSSANCYGYNCAPSVTLGGRVVRGGYGMPLSYGSLIVGKGQIVELTWSAQNVDSCKADNNWTKFTGLYYPPTMIRKPIERNQKYTVRCFVKKQEVASSTLDIVVVTR